MTSEKSTETTGSIGGVGRKRIQSTVHGLLKEAGLLETAWWLMDLARPRAYLLARENRIESDQVRRAVTRWWSDQSLEIHQQLTWLKEGSLPSAFLEGLYPKQWLFFGRRAKDYRILRDWKCVLLDLHRIQKYSLGLCLIFSGQQRLSRKAADELIFALGLAYEKWAQEQSSKKRLFPVWTERAGFSLSEDNLARLAHDFRKPLSNLMLNHQNIYTMVQSTANPLKDNPDLFRDALRRFKDQLEMLDGYTHDLLYLMTGKRPARSETEDFVLEDLIDKILSELDEIHGKHKKITIKREEASRNPCRLHYPYTYRILYNLLENAYKFSANPGIVYLEVARKGYWVRIGIEDNGAGFRLRDEGFELSRLNLNRSGGSWGIGLASAYDLTYRLGGRLLQRRSRHGQGAHFLLILPTEAPPSES